LRLWIIRMATQSAHDILTEKRMTIITFVDY
jgi:hypothetical protein